MLKGNIIIKVKTVGAFYYSKTYKALQKFFDFTG